jgi:serine/threonine-protein kinase
MASENNPSNALKEANQLELDAVLFKELPVQYELIGRVKQGGMGAIYKVRNIFTNQYFAIKVLLPGASDDNAKAVQRFVVEAKAASSLQHPHICKVFDFGVTPNRMPYLVMEWIDGISLADKVARDGPLTASESLRIFQQVASALGHAHCQKVVHRDLKPENLMISQDVLGRLDVHIVDFGIAKVLGDDEDFAQSRGLTKTGMVVGTPLYMSPEQAKASPDIDSRSDIYSLGCVMYFALTGYAPFVGDSTLETMTKHLLEEPQEFEPELKVPVSLQKIVLRAMEKEPADRYQRMDHLGSDLKKLTKGVSVEHPALTAERRTRNKRINDILSFVVAAAIVYALSIVLQNFWDGPSHPQPIKPPSANHAYPLE